MIDKINIERYWEDYPAGANFTYQRRYGDDKIEGIVREGTYRSEVRQGGKLISKSGELMGIISTQGVKYDLNEITLETQSEMKRRIREEKLNQIL